MSEDKFIFASMKGYGREPRGGSSKGTKPKSPKAGKAWAAKAKRQRAAGKGRPGGIKKLTKRQRVRRVIRGILAEFDREASQSRHVGAPCAPTYLYRLGDDPELFDQAPKIVRDLVKGIEARDGRRIKASDAAEMIDEMVLDYEWETGSKVRRDARLMGAGFISSPHSIEELIRSDQAALEFEAFCQLAVELAKEEFKDRLLAMACHWCEGFGHIHMITLPYKVPERNMRLGVGNGDPQDHADNRASGQRWKLMSEAKKAFLDRVQAKIGDALGWKRISQQPRRRIPVRTKFLFKQKKALENRQAMERALRERERLEAQRRVDESVLARGLFDSEEKRLKLEKAVKLGALKAEWQRVEALRLERIEREKGYGPLLRKFGLPGEAGSKGSSGGDGDSFPKIKL